MSQEGLSSIMIGQILIMLTFEATPRLEASGSGMTAGTTIATDQ